MPDNAVSDWVADGATETEPVTTSTPEAEAVEAPPETAPVTTEAVEAPETPPEASPTFIDARLDGEPYELPEGVEIGLKRGDDIEYRGILDVQKSGMLERDYRLKTGEHATTVREFEGRQSQLVREQAALEARSKFLEEQEQQMKDAMTDPAKAAGFAEHLQQYQNNPVYRANVDAALSSREVVAERDALQADADQRVVNDGTRLANEWIEGMSAEFPTVSVARVREMYGQSLQNGNRLDPSEVRRIYESEANYLSESVSPLQTQLAELTAKVASLSGVQAADEHNEATQHAVTRAATPKINTGRGAPTTTPVEPTRFTPRELPGRISDWVKAGK